MVFVLHESKLYHDETIGLMNKIVLAHLKMHSIVLIVLQWDSLVTFLGGFKLCDSFFQIQGNGKENVLSICCLLLLLVF